MNSLHSLQQDQQTAWNSTIESVVKPTPFQQPLGIFVTKLNSRTSHFLPQKLWCVLVVVPLPGLYKILAFVLSDPSASKFPSKYLSSSLTFSGYPPLTPHHTHTLCQMSKVEKKKKKTSFSNTMRCHPTLLCHIGLAQSRSLLSSQACPQQSSWS